MALLETKNVTKRFAGLTAVKDVSFQVEKGEIVGLIGANGAGKTTFFNCITGYYKNEEGQILFEGTDITGNSPAQNCKRGLVRTFQIVKPFGRLSATENVMIGVLNRMHSYREAEKKAAEYMEFVGIADKADAVVEDLNIGDQRKLEMARSLATQPTLLLLDEVMAGLTPTEIEGMIALVRKIRDSGITIFMIEHIMAALMTVSDRVLVLDHGEMIAMGTPEEVTQNPNVIASYLGRSYSDKE